MDPQAPAPATARLEALFQTCCILTMDASWLTIAATEVLLLVEDATGLEYFSG